MSAAGDSTFFNITLGELLDLLALIAGGVGLIFGLGRKTQLIEQSVTDVRADVGDMKADIRKLNDVVTQIAVQSSRMDMIDKRMDDIVHGRIRIANPRGAT
jgi:hypothetical protein